MIACDDMMHTRCEDEVISRQESPDRQIVAITSNRSCANNTGRYTWVGLQGVATEEENREPNGEAVFTVRETKKINIIWRDSRNLEIQTIGRALDASEVITQTSSWKEVMIIYTFK